jgi:hypothetical protein
MNCPCQPNVPCSQGKAYVLSEEEYRICNGEGVTQPEQIAFIKDLCTGKLAWDKENKLPSLPEDCNQLIAKPIKKEWRFARLVLNFGLTIAVLVVVAT